MKKTLVTILLLNFALALGACNNDDDLGDHLEDAGDEIEEAADEVDG